MSDLTWTQRFAIIDYFNPSDEDICKVFEITKEELESARTLRNIGLFNYEFEQATKELIKKYEKIINNITPSEPLKAKEDTTQNTNDTTNKPGPSTHKIKDAYEAIPSEAVPVEEFRQKFNVSLSVLRRHKHFDHIPEKGQVTVQKKIIDVNGTPEKVLCIWRKPKK